MRASNEKSWAQEAAELEEQSKQRAVAEVAWWKGRWSRQQEEVLRQQNLMHGGLIAIGIVMVQPFLTAPPGSFDLSARIWVIAFSVAIPILAALVVVNSQETYRRRLTSSMFVRVARVVAFAAGFAGVVASFWHITPIAGVGILVASMVGVGVQSAGYVRVERDDARTTPKGEDQEARIHDPGPAHTLPLDRSEAVVPECTISEHDLRRGCG